MHPTNYAAHHARHHHLHRQEHRHLFCLAGKRYVVVLLNKSRRARLDGGHFHPRAVVGHRFAALSVPVPVVELRQQQSFAQPRQT